MSKHRRILYQEEGGNPVGSGATDTGSPTPVAVPVPAEGTTRRIYGEYLGHDYGPTSQEVKDLFDFQNQLEENLAEQRALYQDKWTGEPVGSVAPVAVPTEGVHIGEITDYTAGDDIAFELFPFTKYRTVGNILTSIVKSLRRVGSRGGGGAAGGTGSGGSGFATTKDYYDSFRRGSTIAKNLRKGTVDRQGTTFKTTAQGVGDVVPALTAGAATYALIEGLDAVNQVQDIGGPGYTLPIEQETNTPINIPLGEVEFETGLSLRPDKQIEMVKKGVGAGRFAWSNRSDINDYLSFLASDVGYKDLATGAVDEAANINVTETGLSRDVAVPNPATVAALRGLIASNVARGLAAELGGAMAVDAARGVGTSVAEATVADIFANTLTQPVTGADTVVATSASGSSGRGTSGRGSRRPAPPISPTIGATYVAPESQFGIPSSEYGGANPNSETTECGDVVQEWIESGASLNSPLVGTPCLSEEEARRIKSDLRSKHGTS